MAEGCGARQALSVMSGLLAAASLAPADRHYLLDARQMAPTFAAVYLAADARRRDGRRLRSCGTHDVGARPRDRRHPPVRRPRSRPSHSSQRSTKRCDAAPSWCQAAFLRDGSRAGSSIVRPPPPGRRRFARRPAASASSSRLAARYRRMFTGVGSSLRSSTALRNTACRSGRSMPRRCRTRSRRSSRQARNIRSG